MKKKKDTPKGRRHRTQIDETDDRHIRRSGLPEDIKSRLRSHIDAGTSPKENLSDDSDEGLVNPNTV